MSQCFIQSNRSFQQEANIPLAAYARYSSDLQRPASIDDQLRNCREGAPNVHGFIMEDWIRTDSAKSGRNLEGRDGLNQLIDAAVSGNAPFQGILIDDTSRFGRNLTDTLAVLDKLAHAKIFVYFVTQRLDSREPNFRQVYVMMASQDEQYSLQLSKKVHRGQVGRVLAGFLATGRAYGYNSVKVEHPQSTRKGGRAGIQGFALEINPAQANVIKRIFEMCVAGFGVNLISRTLNEERVPTPRGDLGARYGHWTGRNIILILNNKKYIGVNVWNQTTGVWNPNLKRKEIRKRPKEEWIVVEVPAWRIIDDGLWNAAHAAFDRRRPGPRQGGLSRSEKARAYFFSGLLVCGECGGNLNVIENRKNCERYVCYRALTHTRTCCRRSIHRRVLEPRLLQVMRLAIESNLSDRLVRAILERQTQEQVERESLIPLIDLQTEAEFLDVKIKELVGVILRTGTSKTIEDDLRALNTKRRVCQEQLDRAAIAPPALLSKAEAEGLAQLRISTLREVLVAAPEEAKRRFALMMAPIRVTHFQDGKSQYVRCESAFEFEIGSGGGRVSVPFIGEIAAGKEKGRIFPQALLDEVGLNVHEPVTAQEMSKVLKVSRSTVGRWCARWGLPHSKVGFNLMVVPSEVRTWLMERCAPPSRLIWPADEVEMVTAQAA